MAEGLACESRATAMRERRIRPRWPGSYAGSSIDRWVASAEAKSACVEFSSVGGTISVVWNSFVIALKSRCRVAGGGFGAPTEDTYRCQGTTVNVPFSLRFNFVLAHYYEQ